MIQATTPTFTLTLPDSSETDLTEVSKVFFAISQGSYTLKKQVQPTDAHTVEVYLNQSETLNLKDGKPADIQLNWIYADGKRNATKVKSVPVDKQLLKEVLS